MNLPGSAFPEDFTPLERRLAGWNPAPATSARDRFLFEAGVAAGRRQVRWRLAAFLATLAVGSSGWAFRERAERVRLETALATRSGALDHALLTQQPPRYPDVEPIPRVPLSYAGLSRHLSELGFDLSDPVASTPAPDRSSAQNGPVLTPLSGRRAAELLDL